MRASLFSREFDWWQCGLLWVNSDLWKICKVLYIETDVSLSLSLSVQYLLFILQNKNQVTVDHSILSNIQRVIVVPRREQLSQLCFLVSLLQLCYSRCCSSLTDYRCRSRANVAQISCNESWFGEQCFKKNSVCVYNSSMWWIIGGKK